MKWICGRDGENASEAGSRDCSRFRFRLSLMADNAIPPRKLLRRRLASSTRSRSTSWKATDIIAMDYDGDMYVFCLYA